MILLYLVNKYLPYKFVDATNNIEKTISTITKFNYEQTLMSIEITLYYTIYCVISKKNINNPSKFVKKINLIVLPITLYNTDKYIKSKNKQFIDF